MGEVSPSWAKVEDTKALILPRGMTHRQADYGQEIDADFMGIFFPGTDIKPQTSDGLQDRVKANGVIYMVQYVMNLKGRSKVLQVFLKREA